MTISTASLVMSSIIKKRFGAGTLSFSNVMNGKGNIKSYLLQTQM